MSAIRLFAAVVIAAACVTAAGADSPANFAALHRAATLEIGGKRQAATVGLAVPEGATLSTDAGNAAKLTFDDGASLEIEQHTRVAFERFARGIGGVRVRLLSGTIRLDVPEKPRFAARGFTVLTAQARVVFREKKGYVTSTSDEDVVTCLRCRIYDRERCERNDFIVRDASTCLSLSDAAVAVVNRQHGIQMQSSSSEAMVRSVIQQLGGTVAAAEGTPWWKAGGADSGLEIDRSAVALNQPGDSAELTVRDRSDGGNIWWLSVDPRVAVVDFVDPKGACRLHAAGSGRTAIIAFDQLGRYAAVDVDVRGSAAR